MTRKCPDSDCFVICNGDCMNCERTNKGGKSVSLICREDLLQDIAESVVFSCRVGVESAEMRGANKILERIRVAPAISESPESSGCEFCQSDKFEAVGLSHDYGVYLSCGLSRPPENEKFRFCPNCGKKL